MEIQMASGLILECDYMDHSEQHKQANVRIINSSFQTVATIFSNPAETKYMIFGNAYAAGFTKLLAIIDDGDAIRVVLGKE